MDGVPQDKLNQTTTRPPSIGGLNKKDPLDAMPPTDAIRLLNWIPDNGLRSRRGFQEWAINFPGAIAVKTVMGWFGPATTIPSSTLDNPTSVPGKLFGATDTAIYDITNATNSPTLSQALSGNTDAGYMSFTMMANSGGCFLLTASEADGYKYFDGAAWATPTMGAGAGQINGVDPTFFRHVNVWKRRAWFVQGASSKLWYLDTDSITGTAHLWDVGPLLKHGGPVAFTANWTIDAGEGIDDLLIIVSQNGDVIIYKGTDPSSATTFGLQGVYYIGEIPKGRRGYCQLGGDTLLLSVNGIFPVSFITRGGDDMLSVSSGSNLIAKVAKDFSDRIASSFNINGWQLLQYQRDSLLMCNMPDFAAYRSRQFAMNTSSVSKPWTEFYGIPAVCWGTQSSYLFAGTADGKVLIYQGYYDAVAYGASIGTGIVGLIQPAFDNFGTPAQNKDFHMLRPNFYAVSAPGWQVLMNVDYAQADPPTSGTPGGFGGSLWNVGLWNTAIWGSGLTKYRFGDWTECGVVGYCGSPCFVTNVIGDTILMSIDYMIEGSPENF